MWDTRDSTSWQRLFWIKPRRSRKTHKVSATNVSPRPWLWERSPALYRRRAQPESERWRLRLRSKLFKISLIAERLQAQAASSNSLPSWWYKTSWTSLPCCANHPTVPSSFKERSFWASEIARYGNAGIFGNQCFFLNLCGHVWALYIGRQSLRGVKGSFCGGVLFELLTRVVPQDFFSSGYARNYQPWICKVLTPLTEPWSLLRLRTLIPVPFSL